MNTFANILAWSGIFCAAVLPRRAGQIVGSWLYRKGEKLYR
jgi:hypothetical protein